MSPFSFFFFFLESYNVTRVFSKRYFPAGELKITRNSFPEYSLHILFEYPRKGIDIKRTANLNNICVKNLYSLDSLEE